MRLSSRFVRYLQEPHLFDKVPIFLTDPARFRHQQAKKLEPVFGKEVECVEPCKVAKKSSIWNIFGSEKKKPAAKGLENQKKAQGESETVKLVSEDQAESDMKNVSEMGGQVYRTCGPAYVLQKDQLDEPQGPPDTEDEILEEMSKDPSLKGQCDPMPPFQSVELKLIELNDRKLHPLYKKLMSIPKRPSKSQGSATGPAYRTRSGPILPHEFPAHLKINRDMFDKKNIIYEYKRADPPQQLLARIVEMRQNERPQLVKKSQDKDRECSKK